MLSDVYCMLCLQSYALVAIYTKCFTYSNLCSFSSQFDTHVLGTESPLTTAYKDIVATSVGHLLLLMLKP